MTADVPGRAGSVLIVRLWHPSAPPPRYQKSTILRSKFVSSGPPLCRLPLERGWLPPRGQASGLKLRESVAVSVGQVALSVRHAASAGRPVDHLGALVALRERRAARGAVVPELREQPVLVLVGHQPKARPAVPVYEDRSGVVDAVKDAAADGFVGDQAEEAFDLIEPRGRSRREMPMGLPLL